MLSTEDAALCIDYRGSELSNTCSGGVENSMIQQLELDLVDGEVCCDCYVDYVENVSFLWGTF